MLNSRSQLSSLGRAPAQPQPQYNCYNVTIVYTMLQMEPQLNLNTMAYNAIRRNSIATSCNVHSSEAGNCRGYNTSKAIHRNSMQCDARLLN